jgi:predicted ribosomally synthesized peptide with SipW-like signal peptide
MELSRRTVLASLGLMGGGATLGGVGTRALLSDTEEAVTTFSAGELDVELDWQAIHNGTQVDSMSPTRTDGEVAAAFEDVKPGDTGCFSLRVHNDTNPAWVWLAVGIDDETEGQPDPVDETTCTTVGKIENYDGETFDTVEDGTQVDPGVYEFGVDGETVTVEVTITDEKRESGNADEAVAFTAEVIEGAYGLCAVTVKSGTTTETTTFDDCTVSTDEITSPATNKHGIEQGISFVEFAVCETEQATGSNHTDLANEIVVDVFWDDDRDCELDSDETSLFEDEALGDLVDRTDKAAGGVRLDRFRTGTRTLSVSWRLPFEVGNEIQGDEIELSFCIYAEQRRHNDDPESPWS